MSTAMALRKEPRAMERVAVLFNPASGPEEPARRRARLEAALRSAGLDVELWETEPETGARSIARRAVAEGVDRVLVCGGDGTAAEAAEALAGTEIPMALLPGGTGNLLAANLGIPSDPAAALELALFGSARRIDVGRANGRPFLIAAGMGADARMIHDADRELKRRFGFLAYLIAALKQVRRPLARYRVTVDGRVYPRRAQTVLVANVGRLPGGLEIVPGAEPDDGILEVAIIRARSLGDLLRMLWRALLRALGGAPRSDDLVEIHRGRRIVVEAFRPQPYEVDGNEVGLARRLEVTVEPGALRIVAPGAGVGEVSEAAPGALRFPHRGGMAAPAGRGALLPAAEPAPRLLAFLLGAGFAFGVGAGAVRALRRSAPAARRVAPALLAAGAAAGALCAAAWLRRRRRRR